MNKSNNQIKHELIIESRHKTKIKEHEKDKLKAETCFSLQPHWWPKGMYITMYGKIWYEDENDANLTLGELYSKGISRKGLKP